MSSTGTRRRARARSPADFTPGAGEAGFEEEGGVVAKAPSRSVEALQLALELVLQLGIRGDVAGRRRCGRRRAVRAARQAQRPVGQRAHRADAQAVRQRPRQPVEALVDGGGQRYLAAVLLDEVLDDGVPGLALRQQAVDLDAVLGGVAAALGLALEQVVTAAAALAHDVADQPVLVGALRRGRFAGLSVLLG